MRVNAGEYVTVITSSSRKNCESAITIISANQTMIMQVKVPQVQHDPDYCQLRGRLVGEEVKLWRQGYFIPSSK